MYGRNLPQMTAISQEEAELLSTASGRYPVAGRQWSVARNGEWPVAGGRWPVAGECSGVWCLVLAPRLRRFVHVEKHV